MLSIILQTTDTGYGSRGACRAYSCIRHRIWKWGRARQVGYRGVYGSVMCPWFVKGRKSALDYPMAKVPRPAMHNNQCGSIHRKAGWCTKEPSDGIWYRKRGRDWRTT